MSTVVAKSIPEGFLITVSSLHADTTKVLLTLTDNNAAGSGAAGAHNFIKRVTGATSIDFVVESANTLVNGNDYLIIVDERNDANVTKQAASIHETWIDVPGLPNFTVSLSSLDQAIQYNFTDLSSTDISYVQFIVSDMSSSTIDFSATMDAIDVFGKIIDISGGYATSTSGTSVINVLDATGTMVFTNGTEYEVGIIYSNDTGPTATTTATQKVTPSAQANKPTSLETFTGKDLTAQNPTDEKIELTFTRGAQISGQNDTSYNIVVSDGTTTFTKSYLADSSDLSLSSEDITLLLVGGDSGWNNGTSDTTLSLEDGTQYTITVEATNSAGSSGVSDSATATPSGLPPKYDFTAVAVSAGDASFNLTTGVGARVVTATLDSSNNGLLSNVLQNNGSAITSVKIQAFSSNNTEDSSSNISSNDVGFNGFGSISLTTTVVGDFDIILTITNGNGSISSDEQTITSTQPPVDISNNQVSVSPAYGNASDLSSNEIAISWGSIGAPGSTGWGGYSAADMSGSALFGYYVDIYSDAAGTNPVVSRITESATTTSLSSSKTTNTAFVNGTPLYAKITAFNPDGSGNPSDISSPFAPSTEPTVSNSDLATKTFLNKLVKNSHLPTAVTEGITLGFTDVDTTTLTTFASDIADVSFNGGYDISGIYFELVNAGTTLTSGTITIDSDGFADRTFTEFATNLLSSETDWVLHAYYLNTAYTKSTRPSSSSDVSTNLKISYDKATVNTLIIDPSDGECTVSFNKVQPDDATETTKYVITLSESRPELIFDSSNILYSDFSDFSANPIDDTSGSSFSSTFDGLTNGFKYKASVKTVSKELNGTLGTTHDDYQVALADTSFNTTVASADSKMPFGPPSITPVPPSGTTTGFTVQANGSSIQDAILITPGDNDNIEDITTVMLNSTKSGNTLNNEIYYEDPSGIILSAPFGNYFAQDASGNFTDTSFNYIANEVVNTTASGQYFFIVSGKVGHYSVASSDSSFSALFPGTNRSN